MKIKINNENVKVIFLVGIGIIVLIVVVLYLAWPKYQCPDKTYTLKNKRCLKTEESSTYQKLNCPDGYVVEDNHCAKITTKEPKHTYTCQKGYKLSGQTCSKLDQKSLVTNYYCSGNKTEEKTCEKYTKPKTDYSTGRQYCETGTLRGSNCVTVSSPVKRIECPKLKNVKKI